MKHYNAFRRARGSAILAVLFIITALSMITASSISLLHNRRIVVAQSGAWREALCVAESGVHEGIARLELSLVNGTLPTAQATYQLSLPRLAGIKGNLGSSTGSAEYTITPFPVEGRTYSCYRIRSLGKVELPSRALTLSDDSRDVGMRKLNLKTNTQKPLTVAERVVEVWVKPRLNTDGPLQTDGALTLNNHNIVVDSFDSSDPARSVSGQPSSVAGHFNTEPYAYYVANVATNSQFAEAGNALIYGDVLTNGGTVGNTEGIKGEVRDDYDQPLAPVTIPDWAKALLSSPSNKGVAITTTATHNGSTTTTTSTVTNVNKAATIRGGTAASPTRAVIDSISLSGNTDQLIFDFGVTGSGAGATADNTKKYVELYVTGNVTTRGGGNLSTESGSIVLVSGMEVKMYIAGDLNLGGNGMTNNNSTAASLSLYGVTPTSGNTTQDWQIAGNAAFYGTIYAPNATVQLAGGGSNGTFVGAISALSARLNGNVNLRYDEALSKNGLVTGFKITKWIEDVKK